MTHDISCCSTKIGTRQEKAKKEAPAAAHIMEMERRNGGGCKDIKGGLLFEGKKGKSETSGLCAGQVAYEIGPSSPNVLWGLHSTEKTGRGGENLHEEVKGGVWRRAGQTWGIKTVHRTMLWDIPWSQVVKAQYSLTNIWGERGRGRKRDIDQPCKKKPDDRGNRYVDRSHKKLLNEVKLAGHPEKKKKHIPAPALREKSGGDAVQSLRRAWASARASRKSAREKTPIQN